MKGFVSFKASTPSLLFMKLYNRDCLKHTVCISTEKLKCKNKSEQGNDSSMCLFQAVRAVHKYRCPLQICDADIFHPQVFQ